LGRTCTSGLRVLAGHLGDVGKELTRATEAYNEAVGSFESRALVGARRFAELGAEEAKLIVELAPVELQPRQTRAEEVKC
jgi:DNA recombination protein RmuC